MVVFFVMTENLNLGFIPPQPGQPERLTLPPVFQVGEKFVFSRHIFVYPYPPAMITSTAIVQAGNEAVFVAIELRHGS